MPPAQVILRNDRTQAILTNIRPAIARALSRAIATVRTDTTRKLAAKTGLKQALIRDRLLVRPASRDRLEARMTVSHRAVPLIEEKGVAQVKTGVRTPRGIIRGGFIRTMRSGHRGAFRRKGRARLPIRELVSESLPRVSIEEGILASSQAVGEAAFTKNLTHELGRVISP